MAIISEQKFLTGFAGESFAIYSQYLRGDNLQRDLWNAICGKNCVILCFIDY